MGAPRSCAARGAVSGEAVSGACERNAHLRGRRGEGSGRRSVDGQGTSALGML